MTGSRFCICTDTTCELNPANHDQGCDLCIEDSIKTKEIPKCFFDAAGGDITAIEDWSFENFAKLVSDK